ncbi:MAG: heparan-alpha-glucosaminide N-acetyltransferase domain-containing protein [Pseudomonadota bacterium]
MPPLPARSQAIDVLRGLTVALMIVVNMSVSETKSFAPLLHAVWHGLTLTDLVFPTFLFVVGASLAFTLDRYQSGGTPAVLRKVLTRALLIFLCGFFLYWFPFVGTDASGHFGLLPLAKARIPGVLQRIALCYAIAALVVHFGGRRAAVFAAITALLAYWAALYLGGDYSLTGNAVLAVDHLLLGDAHLYRGEGIPFDPEGLLSTLPAVANVLAGYLAARLVREGGATWETISRLLLAAVPCIVVALCWSAVLPFNKKLWTSSYALCTIGIDLAVLGTLVYWLDLRRVRGWTPFFEAFGRNTLFIYLLSEVVSTILNLVYIGPQPLYLWLYAECFESWAGSKVGSLLYSVAFMLCCWLVAFAMDRRKIYIKL